MFDWEKFSPERETKTEPPVHTELTAVELRKGSRAGETSSIKCASSHDFQIHFQKHEFSRVCSSREQRLPWQELLLKRRRHPGNNQSVCAVAAVQGRSCVEKIYRPVVHKHNFYSEIKKKRTFAFPASRASQSSCATLISERAHSTNITQYDLWLGGEISPTSFSH